MGVALEKAQKFDVKANAQEKIAKMDETIHDELIHEADLASRILTKEKDHARKIELLRESIDDSLSATEQAVRLHQRRLKNLKAKAAQELAAAAGMGRRMAVLQAGKAKMDGSIAQLRNEVARMKARLAAEESQAGRPWKVREVRAAERMRRSKARLETAAAANARRRAAQAVKAADSDDTRALALQRQADRARRALHARCGPGAAGGVQGCDGKVRARLTAEVTSLEAQAKDATREGLLHQKEASVRRRAALVQATLARADDYKARQAGDELRGEHEALLRLRSRIRAAPARIRAAETSLQSAEDEDLRLQEGAEALGEQQGAARATAAKEAALGRLQAAEIRRIAGLMGAQESASETATAAVGSQETLAAAARRRRRLLLHNAHQAAALGLAHRAASSRWLAAATALTKEAKAYGEVAAGLIRENAWAARGRSAAREQRKMQVGLELLAAKIALQRYRRDPRDPRNRRQLARLLRTVERRLGSAPDPQENAIALRTAEQMQDALGGVATLPREVLVRS